MSGRRNHMDVDDREPNAVDLLTEAVRHRDQAITDLERIVIELRHQLGAVTQQALHTNTAYQRRIDELLQERASREA